jgi:glycosidase/carbohydrate-binding DOMON domain-containing protein
MKRREFIRSSAGLGAFSAIGSVQMETRVGSLSSVAAAGDGYHPGPPRFVQVGERLADPIFVDASHGLDRDHLAPGIPAPGRDPDNYDASDFEWSIAERPAASSAELQYATTPYDDRERYDEGKQSVAEFEPDVPGRYVLELSAPDGTHRQEIHVFPAAPSGAGGPPRIEMDGEFDPTAGEFVVETTPKLAPNSNASAADLEITAIADDRDPLSTADVTVEGTTIRVPESAVDGGARVHAAAFDGEVHSVADVVELDADSRAVEYPNRPPEWMEEGVMYEIFTRSFAGERGETDFQFLTEKVNYLEELGVDVVWLTPIVPAVSSNLRDRAGGGPHGYDTLDYFGVAPDLASDGTTETALKEYRQFIRECNDRGIKVCFDFVINHCGRDHPFFQDTIGSQGDEPPFPDYQYPPVEEWNADSKYFDWFDRMDEPIVQDGEQIAPAPASTGFFGLRVMPNLNWSNLALREHVLAAADFWSDEVGVDAFRCDIAWGVPHDFWKEVRDVVRANDSEFMLLDETIPNKAEFAASEFDAHFDTFDYMETLHEVAKGATPAQELYDRIVKRRNEGFPEHTLVMNTCENHDERRLLKSVIDAGTRENPETAQRAGFAASVGLPGPPMIYYGQERQISNYGTNRYGGPGDDRDGDVGPGKYKRAFMNWEEQGDTVPEDHLQFYEDLVSFYRSTDLLEPDADLVEPWYEADDDDLLVFGRDAGDRKAVVLVNFGPDATEVNLRGDVSTRDVITGNDVGVDSDASGTTVSVETVAILETPSFLALGEEVATLAESAGDDVGPGSYTYPTDDRIPEGAFDLSAVSIHRTDETFQFAVTVDAPIENPRRLPEGFCYQHLQFYLKDPTDDGGTDRARDGVGVTFGSPYQYRVDGDYQYRVVADGRDGVRVERFDGERLAEGEVVVDPAAGTIVVEFPRSAFEPRIEDLFVAPLLLGFDESATGNVMQAESSAGRRQFGGAEGDSAPNVIDMVTPLDVSQSRALAYGDDPAALPFVPLETEYETTAVWEDPAGDGTGPGEYTMPTAGEFAPEAFDLERFAISQNRSRIRFAFTMGREIANPYGLEEGVSLQFFQVYLRDPDASGGDARGRAGLTADFEAPYHYRVTANGERDQRVEAPGPDVEEISGDVDVAVDGNTVTVDVPKSAFEAPIEGMEIAPLVCGYDGFGEGNLRDVTAEAGDYTFGGGSDDAIEPRVLDLVTPEGVDQAEALSYASSSRATIPFVPYESGAVLGRIDEWSDPVGDDDGPGSYTYPTTDEIRPGSIDVTNFAIEEARERWRFVVDLEGPILDPFDGDDGFSVQHFQLYVRDPEASDAVPSATEGRTATNVTFEAPYHYQVTVDGFREARAVEFADGSLLTRDVVADVDQEDGTIVFGVPKGALGGDLASAELSVLAFGLDGFSAGRIRPVNASAGEYTFGGGRDDDVNPNVVDVVLPDGVDQSDALDYAEGSPAELPYLSPGDSGRGSESLPWRERFDDLPTGTTVDDGETAWEATAEGDPELYGTDGQEFRAQGTDGEVVWRSAEMDVADAGGVDLSVRVRGDAALFDDDFFPNPFDDSLEVAYELDGTETVVEEFGWGIDEEFETVEATGLEGERLRVVIRAETTAAGEFFAWDDVTITPVDGEGDDGEEDDEDPDEGDEGGEPRSERYTGTVSQPKDVATHVHELSTTDPERVVVDLTGPSDADFDLYVTLDGREPSRFDYDRRSWTRGSDERIEITADANGTAELGLLVRAYGGSGEYTLTVKEEPR